MQQKHDTVSQMRLQIMWNRLISIVEEQAITLVRTAFSTSVREASDLSAGVFNKAGDMVAQAVTGTPGHVNAMGEAVGHFINVIGRENIHPGDVYITNDPWKGTGHLHDFTVVSPAFHKEELVGFFACTAHVVDVGGRGFGPDASEVYEEGIFVPIMKFADRGVVNAMLIDIMRNNVRESDQVIGDLYSLAACNEVGQRRLVEMLEEFQLADIENLSEFIFDNSYRATIEQIAKLPKGEYTNTMRVDGYGAPVDLAVKLTVKDEEIIADFAGTSGPSPLGINVPLIYTTAYAAYGLKVSLAAEIPNNAASLKPFKVVAPKDCILNAQRPAAVAVRHVLGHFVPDTILGAVHKMMPEVVPAEGAGALWNIHLSARPTNGQQADGIDLHRSEILLFNSGGSGARPGLDGLNATAFPSGVHSMSVEATENVGPIVVWRKELREGSGGAGRQRGGLGQVVEISTVEGHEFHFNAMFDRIDNPARGRDGGEDGQAGRAYLDDGTALQGKGRQFVPEGRRLVIELPGGGGYGKPEARTAEAHANDLADQYLKA
ncbi:hydantoinase B/oxoprolinase family protein [Pseudomonas sp. GX19020]|uniref:hydantoinase B/oxoprolinase family protein n=1 Tax=Pseudomonas sp. GX19020 TaxID=2942277 RepID=UPI00201966A2|nr:hydantoinase B/oxoprolinase family protein [Pseudomonas sp. GX19020]MCL4068088.1 hydantoinase B/oxoprolinase family protein [Pseudomonas sp. GX19020]